VKQEDQDVQGAMEPSYRVRSYLGKRRRVEGIGFQVSFSNPSESWGRDSF
jgi:hypothetical protein